MADTNAALLAFIGVLVGGYVNNFLAEDFRRFRDSQALAGALAGELESHSEAIPHIKTGLQNVMMYVESGTEFEMPEWPVPNSPIFEANADKIGLLRPDHAKDVAYVYEQIRAFRSAFNQLSKHHGTMGDDWQKLMTSSCLATIDRAKKKGLPLVDGLKHHASCSYWRRPETRKQLLFRVAFFAAITFGSWPFYHTVSLETGTNCTTVLDHSALHTTCK